MTIRWTKETNTFDSLRCEGVAEDGGKIEAQVFDEVTEDGYGRAEYRRVAEQKLSALPPGTPRRVVVRSADFIPPHPQA